MGIKCGVCKTNIFGHSTHSIYFDQIMKKSNACMHAVPRMASGKKTETVHGFSNFILHNPRIRRIDSVFDNFIPAKLSAEDFPKYTFGYIIAKHFWRGFVLLHHLKFRSDGIKK